MDLAPEATSEASATCTDNSAELAVAGQVELPLETATAVADDEIAVAEVETPAPAAAAPEVLAEQAPVPAPKAEKPRGLTEQGRAVNDPRVSARPVGVVEIVTTHPALFTDFVAPPVAPSDRITPRASNDPRGPAVPEVAFAEAAGQS